MADSYRCMEESNTTFKASIIKIKINKILKDTCTPMLITALFTIVKIRKPQCSSTNEQIKKMHYVQKCQLLSHMRLWNPMDCSPSGSSIHGILQARILDWVAISFLRGSSQPRDQIHVSCLAGRFFTTESPGKPLFTQPLEKNKILPFATTWMDLEGIMLLIGLTLFFWAPKSLQMVIAAMELKDAYSLEGKL